MFLSAVLPLLLMQVGPNPSAQPVSPIPPEMAEQRARNAEQQREAAQVEQSRYVECLMLARENADGARIMAEGWLAASQGAAAARAGQCLGMALFGLGQFAEAAQAFGNARALVPASAASFRATLGALQGNAALAGGDGAGAVAAFDDALVDAVAAHEPQLLGDTQIDRARALVAMGEDERAVQGLADARQTLPENATAWLLSATLSRRLGQLPLAQQQIERAGELAPRDPAVGLEAGVIAALAGQDESARRSFQSVIALAPDSEEARKAGVYLGQLPPEAAPASTTAN